MTQAEVFLYLAYLIPMLAYVLWPEAGAAAFGASRSVSAPGAKPSGTPSASEA